MFGRHLLSYMLNLAQQLGQMSCSDACEASKIAIDLVTATLNREQRGAGPVSERLYPHFLKKEVKQFVEGNLHRSDLSIETIAEHFKISRTHLCRLFEREHGVKTYIRERRLTLARKQLVTGDLGNRTISELAASVGYSNSAAFTRAFKQRFDVSPSELMAASAHGISQPEGPRAWESWFLGL